MPVTEGEKLLERTIVGMEQQKQAVKAYFDGGANMDGLHCCASALRSLRTSGLSPKAYYELYIKAVEVLNMVDVYLTDEFRQGNCIPHLYEMVQYFSNVLPRLYLLITVGVVYMRVGELPIREILRDLVEMCRGVQHPLRGLFLRNFLLTSIPPNLLPDTLPPDMGAEEAEGVNGSPTQVDVAQGKENAAGTTKTSQPDSSADVLDSINFILLNFAEMNKLWVRMQHQGHTRERERREQERRDLRVLVGANLHRLSQLSSITPRLYRLHILPSILTQVIECRDVIAQEYLMDVIVQTFPDDFHAATLPQLLQACEHLQPAVKLKPIISSLVERLLRYVSEEENGSGEVLFRSLSVELGELAHRRGELYSATSPVTVADARIGLPPEDVPGLFAPLLSMAIALPESIRTNQVNAVLLSAATALETLSSSTVRIQGGSILSRELLGLLYLPLYGSGGPPRLLSSTECATLSIFSSGVPNPPPVEDHEKDSGRLGCLSTLLSLSGLRKLCALLDVAARRRFASLFISRAVERSSTDPESQRITTDSDLDALCEVIGVLIDRQDMESSVTSSNSDDTTEELSLLAASIQLIGKCDDEAMEEKLALLSKMRKRLATGGAMVIKATFPTLVFEVTQLLSRCTTEELSERLIAFCHQSNTKLIANNAADIALRLFLHCTLVITHSESALSAERASLFAYEFFSQAFTLFEQGQQLGDARCQFAAFEALVSTLVHASPRCHLLDGTEAVLRTQVSRAATTLLLLRADQSRAVAISGQLFLPNPSSEVKEGTPVDSEGVYSCLDKSRSLADMCMDIDTRTQLYVDLLNYHIIYHQQGVGPLENMKSRMNDLLTEMEKLSNQLEFVPQSLALYLKTTRAKALEIIKSS
ncbi:unnamed protein product [Hymenolepis diminuta]|uniref:Vacuolar protein sorting-associated protein 35 n=1 Tax=Hymenolepis diminuta TaxID=6216 RepID=A0A564Y319_HYMDI|nr:unnamed protein product [Hymenolepis diminuta]